MIDVEASDSTFCSQIFICKSMMRALEALLLLNGPPATELLTPPRFTPQPKSSAFALFFHHFVDKTVLNGLISPLLLLNRDKKV